MKWTRVPGYFAAATFTFLAGLVADSLSAMVFLVTGKATFRTTNDAAENLPTAQGTDGAAAGKPAFLTRLAGYDPNHWSIFLLEAVVGCGFLLAMWIHKNLWFLGPGMALVLSPVVAWSKGGWERRWVRVLAAGPAVSLAGLLVLIGWQLLKWR